VFHRSVLGERRYPAFLTDPVFEEAASPEIVIEASEPVEIVVRRD
jgi:hypothetical protein